MGQEHREGEVAEVVHRNIKALLAVRRRFESSRSPMQRGVDAVTGFAGSVVFLLVHVALIVGWFLVNLGWVWGVGPFDPFPFVMLAMVASVEALFLAIFVLITQNRMQRLADRRADLDLQVNLLSEHEVTRLITLVAAIASHLGVPEELRSDIDELKRDVRPEQVLDSIEEAEEEGPNGSPHARH